MMLNGLSREEIERAGLGWILDDPAEDDRLIDKIIERLMALPVGEVVVIKDLTKIPHIRAANRSAIVYNAIEIDEAAGTFTKVRECRIHRLAPYMGGKPLKIG
jgi:hypothetical protein